MKRALSHYDAIVIGGGPAGASASAILAEHGRRVLVLEREKFPRYHIGESLLPFTFGPLNRLGMIPKMRQSRFVKKYSASFVQPEAVLLLQSLRSRNCRPNLAGCSVTVRSNVA
jgi:2-polyprenyl-6-methoxyphenol hydroxylase-like FAD-dependent oxidoreductase